MEKRISCWLRVHGESSPRDKPRTQFKSDLAAQAFDKIKKTCRILQARTLLFQTPASFTPGYLDDAQQFFKNMDSEGFI